MRGDIMIGDAAEYIGSIPQHYDRCLGPLIFIDYAADIAQVSPLAVRRGCWRQLPAPGLLPGACAICCLPMCA
jgi:hypothetical protein